MSSSHVVSSITCVLLPSLKRGSYFSHERSAWTFCSQPSCCWLVAFRHMTHHSSEDFQCIVTFSPTSMWVVGLMRSGSGCSSGLISEVRSQCEGSSVQWNLRQKVVSAQWSVQPEGLWFQCISWYDWSFDHRGCNLGGQTLVHRCSIFSRADPPIILFANKHQKL